MTLLPWVVARENRNDSDPFALVYSGATQIGQYVGTLTDALSLVRAIQTGQALPVVATGLRLANDLGNLNGTASYELSAAASSVLSLYGLVNALDRGDTLGAITLDGNGVVHSQRQAANDGRWVWVA